MEPGGVEVPIVWQGRRTRAFVPTALADRDLTVATTTLDRVVRAQVAVEEAAAALPEDHLPLARLLLRAEGLASSFVEGVGAPVLDVVLAEAGAQEGHGGAAPWVAANLAAVDQALAEVDAELTVDGLCRWHRTLMAGSPTPARHVGVLRTEQGWIGGTSPLDAHLVTPPPAEVPRLVDDLLGYVARDDVAPVVQAAVAHAQFEVVHPFADGNGRIGRVLVGWILARRLALVTPPPISTRIAADVGGYAAGLVRYRLGDLDGWVAWFADAVSGAGRTQRDLVDEVGRLRRAWRERLDAPRPEARRLRADAAAWRVLDLVPRHLLLTAASLADELGLPPKTARAALADLVAAGILVEHGDVPASLAPGPGRPARLYVSPELLGLAGATPLRG